MASARVYPSPTLWDAAFPSRGAWAGALAVLALSLFTALCAQISIPLPFTPVPLTGTTLGVLYAGALLGPRLGAAAAALYLLEGGCGLPFFAGGTGSWAHFAGPTGGYLAGFIPAAWATGALARRGWDRSPWTAAAMMLLGSSLVFLFGLAGLARFLPAGALLKAGLWPFIPGDILKAGLAAALLPFGWRRLGR